MKKYFICLAVALIQLNFIGQVHSTDNVGYSLAEFSSFVPGDLVFENSAVRNIDWKDLGKKRFLNVGFASRKTFSIGEINMPVDTACDLHSAEPYYGKVKKVKKNTSFEKWAKKNKVDSFAYVIAFNKGEKPTNISCVFSGKKASFRLTASPDLIKVIESEIDLRKINYQKSLTVTIDSKFDPESIEGNSLISCRPISLIERCDEVSTNFYETSLNAVASLKKGPYESSAQFETRKKDEVRGKSESHWIIKTLTPKDYNADKQSIELRNLGKGRTLHEDVQITHYTGENAFGVQKGVTKWRGSIYEANVEVPQSFTDLSLVDYISYNALLPFDSKELQKREGRLAVASKVRVFADNPSSDWEIQSPTIRDKQDKDIKITKYRAVLERLFIFDVETDDIIYELEESTEAASDAEMSRTVRVPSWDCPRYRSPRIEESQGQVVIHTKQIPDDCRALAYLDSDGEVQSIALQSVFKSPGDLSSNDKYLDDSILVRARQ